MRHHAHGRLVAIECDRCGALIAPHPAIAESGWVKCGTINENGTRFDFDYCPTHAFIAEDPS